MTLKSSSTIRASASVSPIVNRTVWPCNHEPIGTQNRTKGDPQLYPSTLPIWQINPSKRRDARHVLPNNQRVNVMGALVRLHRLKIHHVPHDGVLVRNARRSKNVPRHPRTLQRHPDIVLLSH